MLPAIAAAVGCHARTLCAGLRGRFAAALRRGSGRIVCCADALFLNRHGPDRGLRLDGRRHIRSVRAGRVGASTPARPLRGADAFRGPLRPRSGCCVGRGVGRFAPGGMCALSAAGRRPHRRHVGGEDVSRALREQDAKELPTRPERLNAVTGTEITDDRRHIVSGIVHGRAVERDVQGARVRRCSLRVRSESPHHYGKACNGNAACSPHDGMAT